MRFLFDQNLPPRLCFSLAELAPGSVHVRDVGMRDADDDAIWEYAQHNRLVIVTKDGDFQRRSALYGHPPKVVWLRVGNCSVEEIESLLRRRIDVIEDFGKSPDKSILIIARH